MKILFTKQKFSKTEDGPRVLTFSSKALLRAVVSAGRRPVPGPRSIAVQSDIDMRISAIKSAITLTKEILVPTDDYLVCGPTSRAQKSFFIGNALCAIAADKDLGIPWLLDIERLDAKYSIQKKRTSKRPDFLGHTPSPAWFVFESKGRSSKPGPKPIGRWKNQADSIEKVNRRRVQNGIVSAAYLNRIKQWELLWVDPSPEDDAQEISFDEFSFFEAYYRPIIDWMSANRGVNQVSDDNLILSRDGTVHIGLHRDVVSAVQERNSEAIRSFALRLQSDEFVEPDGTSLFRDGLRIRLGPEWNLEVLGGTMNPDISVTAIRKTEGKSRSRVVTMIGKPERVTQNRVVRLFVDELGYRYLGDWSDREGNSNIEESLLSANLTGRGYSPAQIAASLHKVRTEATNPNRSLYENNREVYGLLRYGAKVKIGAGELTEDVRLIDWKRPSENDFAVAEEVTLKGANERRPDLVLYVNGIALAVIELKCSRVSIGDGIRQLLSNQQREFNEWFFSTVQFVFAGNDTEGLQYGTILTPEKYFLKWKEDEEDNSRFKLDKYLLKMCSKERLLELVHDFVLFDGGIKKVPRVHQFVGIKRAQEHARRREGGIIWHTQGSGKSIVMVLLGKWILENNPNARVAIITDRDELDDQIERVFNEAGEAIVRTTSGRDLLSRLSQAKPRLLCSLVHKFGHRTVDDFDVFIKELEAQPSATVGEVFVFVDECHRTQSGKLHRVMKALMPNAVFVGFTGTPLLAKDKATSLEVFGRYIHTYKFNEAVEDEVVLDLVYEARDIDQSLGSEDKIDQWFDAKTKGLNNWQKDELRKKWGTMQVVLSSRSRMDRVINDILFDFSVKPRLSSERGNAILVASTIYEACKYFDLLQKTPFRGRCALITSYNPQAGDVSLEEVGANTETDKQFIYNNYRDLLKEVVADSGESKTETYEKRAKQKFIKEPANMKLLVVVDKLLTGFDAPPCSYLYIDKSMRDHALFQAICRTNRLDGEDKDFGYIVDYKDLFKRVENAMAVYTSELDHTAGGTPPEVMIQDRLTKGRERLDNALEILAALCEPVEAPKGELEYIRYFCGNTEIDFDLEEHEPQRAALYKSTASLVRAYGNIADEMESAKYSAEEIARIKQQIAYYLDLRETIRRASGESLDAKAYEADMRHLIDTYIEADEPRKISPFGEMGLIDLIVKTGIGEAIAAQLGVLKGNKEAIAETIENNVRRKIIKEQLIDPAYYETMSALLDEIIAARKARAIEYEEYLKRIAELAKKVNVGHAEDIPRELGTPGLRALYNNLNKDAELAIRIDTAVKGIRPDAWRGHPAREQAIKSALYGILKDELEVERVFLIIKGQREY